MKRSGFTLLEILLTLLLLVLLLGILHACFGAVLASTEHGRAITRAAVEGRNLLAMLEADLRGSLLLSPPEEESADQNGRKPSPPTQEADPYAFVASAAGPDRTDRVRLVSSAPPRGVPLDSPRVPHVIEYRLTPVGSGAFALTRSATDVDAAGNHTTWTVSERVDRLSVQFFDGTQWLTEWNSEEDGCLPLAIRVDLALRLGDRAEEGTLELAGGSPILLGTVEPHADDSGKEGKGK